MSVSGYTTDPEPTTVPFWLKPRQHLELVSLYGVYQAFAYADHTVHPRPYPPDAGRNILASRVGCRSFDRGILCRRASTTARYLAASPPKGTADGTAGSITLARVEQLLLTLITSHVIVGEQLLVAVLLGQREGQLYRRHAKFLSSTPDFAHLDSADRECDNNSALAHKRIRRSPPSAYEAGRVFCWGEYSIATGELSFGAHLVRPACYFDHDSTNGRACLALTPRRQQQK